MISVITPPGVILKALSLPSRHVDVAGSVHGDPSGHQSVFPVPSPVESMISVITPPGVILKAL